MKIEKRELQALVKNYADVEIYKSAFGKNSFHTDDIKDCEYESIDDLPDEFDGEWTYMDEDDYNHSIYANCGETENFAERFGDKDAKIMCVLVY